MDQRNEIFESGPIRKAYITLVIPVVLSMLVTMAYNLLDTYFVAKTADANIVAAVSLCSPIFLLLIALGDLFGIGGSSVVSRLFGERKDEDGTRVSAFSFYITFLFGILIAAILLLLRGPILNLMGAEAETFASARDYFTVIAIGSPFIMISYIPANLLRTEGLATMGMCGTILGAVVNIILDPILIFGLGWDAFGAALATVIANVCTDVFFIILLSVKKTRISLNPFHTKIPLKYFGMIVAVGVPACITNVLNSFAQTFTNNYLKAYGSTAIAAMGIVIKINLVINMVLVGMAFGSQPLIGFNYGAKNKKRLRDIIKFCLAVQVIFTAVAAAVLAIFAPQLVGFFMKDATIVKEGAEMLRFLEAGMIFTGLILVFSCICQATGKGKAAMVIAISRQGFVFYPLMILLHYALGYYGVITAQPIVDFISCVISFALYWHSVHRELVG